MSDIAQILDDEKPVEQPEQKEQVVETTPDEATEAQEEIASDDVAESEPEVVEPEQSEAEKGLLAELTKLRQELRSVKAQPQQEARPLPDVIEDPSGFASTIQADFQQKLENERLNMSEAMARQQFGDDKVNVARDALLSAVQSGDATATATYQQIVKMPNPYAELVKWHGQQEFVKRVGSDPDAFMAKERERMKAEILAEIEAQQTAKVVKSAPSLAAETSIGSRSSSAAPTLTPLDDILG